MQKLLLWQHDVSGEGIVLHNILGFGGRMGRLEYFLAIVGLGFLMIMLVVALIAGFRPPHLSYGEKGPVPGGFMIIFMGLVLPIYLWFALAFQAKRYRDMGWNPLYVIPGSIGTLSIIMLLSPFVPGLALIGVLLNILLSLCRLFWPSQPTGDGDWYSGSYRDGSPDFGPALGREPALTPRRSSMPQTSAPPPVFTPAASGFGRRGL
ncbi:MAG: DUF805 domain-containing protein [Sphingomonas bacterium]